MRHVFNLLGVALLTATGLMTTGIAIAGTSSGMARDQLQDLRGEARQVRSSALYIDRITSQPGTTWQQVDKQWNMIKPAEEAMVDHIHMLETMKKSLTPAELKALQDAKPQVDQIAERTHQLRAMLDKQGANIQSPEFKNVARQMARDASEVAHRTELSVTQTASR